jgi:hypothetical protein
METMVTYLFIVTENPDEKFVLLLQERELLYNTKQKNHNRNVSNNLCGEVVQELHFLGYSYCQSPEQRYEPYNSSYFCVTFTTTPK